MGGVEGCFCPGQEGGVGDCGMNWGLWVGFQYLFLKTYLALAIWRIYKQIIENGPGFVRNCVRNSFFLPPSYKITPTTGHITYPPSLRSQNPISSQALKHTSQDLHNHHPKKKKKRNPQTKDAPPNITAQTPNSAQSPAHTY